MATQSVSARLTASQRKYLDKLDTDNKTNKLTMNQNMGQEQFLNILMTQLANQNPLDPMQDKDFIAQMAQFSSVESMQAMKESFDSVEGNISAIKTSMDTMAKGNLSQKQVALLDQMRQSLDAIASSSSSKLNDAIKADKTATAYK